MQRAMRRGVALMFIFLGGQGVGAQLAGDSPYLRDAVIMEEVDHLMLIRAVTFAHALATGDLEAVLAAYQPWYVREQGELGGANLAYTSADQLLLLANIVLAWSSAWYAEGSPPIASLDDIREAWVERVGPGFVGFAVQLANGSRVHFELEMDRETLQFFGPYG